MYYCWSRYNFKRVKKEEKMVELWEQALSMVGLENTNFHSAHGLNFWCPCILDHWILYPNSSKSQPTYNKNSISKIWPWVIWFFFLLNINLGMLTQLLNPRAFWMFSERSQFIYIKGSSVSGNLHHSIVQGYFFLS